MDLSIKVQEVKPLGNFILFVVFTNGVKKFYDVKQLFPVMDEMFAPLQDNPKLFREIHVDCGGSGIAWNENIDISECELWENGIDENPEPIKLDYIAEKFLNVQVDYSKYNPYDFPYPLNQDMEKFYRACESEDWCYRELYAEDLYLTIKQAAVSHYFSQEKALEMQQYFWGLVK